MISISPLPSIQRRYLEGPLLAEREQYLVHLIREGVDRQVLRRNAAYLVHIVRILGLNEFRVVSEDEIQRAGTTWAQYRGPLRLNQRLREYAMR